MKNCRKCGVFKPLEDFGKDPNTRDGRVATCKPCKNSRAKELYDPQKKAEYYADHRSDIRRKQGAGYLKNKSKILRKSKERYSRLRPKLLAQKKEYHKRHRPKLLERQKAKHLRNRSRLDSLKTGPCQDCGRCFPPSCLDFDHRPGTTKRANVGNLYQTTKEALLAEVAKCDLVCKVCHRIRTAARRPTRKTRNKALEGRLSYLVEAKRSPCSNCGKTFEAAAMDFHHSDPKRKVHGIARLARSASLQRLKDEISQCVLLCANCHALHHFHIEN